MTPFFLLCAIGLPAFTLQAQQGPTMEITWTNFLAEWDIYHPGLERVFQYTIRNTSPPSATNNLFYLNLPTGIDAGLFYAWFDQFPLEWQVCYGGGSTTFANTNHPVIPGNAIVLEIRADTLATRSSYVTAKAVGESAPIDVTPVLVEVPAGPYPPPRLTSIVVETNNVTLTADSLLYNYHYTLEQSAGMLEWTNVADFWVTWGNTDLKQTVSLPLSTNAPGQFFRLRSP